MESSNGAPNVKKFISKSNSFQSDGLKRKKHNVETLDLEVGHVKKTKTGIAELSSPSKKPPHLTMERMCIESRGNETMNPEQENVSMMSINFSQYELMRNLSQSNFRSDEGSQTTCSTLSLVDGDLKNEQLERYFKSVDKWNKQFQENNPYGPKKKDCKNEHFERYYKSVNTWNKQVEENDP